MARSVGILALLPVALCAGPLHLARLGAISGGVSLQVHAFDPLAAALPNTPLIEGSRVLLDSGARAEIELDDGSALRLTGESLAELSDDAELSTGQRSTLFTLDHGTAYLSARRSIFLAMPGAQINLRPGARVRCQVTDRTTEIAVLDGRIRFATPTAELELSHGQLALVEPEHSSRFRLLREIPELDADRWSDHLDQAERESASASSLPSVRYGALDLDTTGTWFQTKDWGAVWKPKVATDWTPFREGVWRWYDELGYTWISAEPWGWTPYHHGRWVRSDSLGWVWWPGSSARFRPGDVYWIRGTGFAGWGPLAPDERAEDRTPARWYALAHTTLARFAPGVAELRPDPDLPRPKDLVSTGLFVAGLPSPPFLPDRLDAVREPLRATVVKLLSSAGEVSVPGAGYESRPAPPPPFVVQAPSPPRTVVVREPVEVPEPVEVYYPFPVWSGFIVMNPPCRNDPKQKGAHSPDAKRMACAGK